MSRLPVDAIAAWRLTKLITQDEITRPIRERIIKKIYGGNLKHASNRVLGDPRAWEDGAGLSELAESDPEAPKLVKLVMCPACVGVYVGFGVMVLSRLAPKAWEPVSDALAMAAVAGVIIE